MKIFSKYSVVLLVPALLALSACSVINRQEPLQPVVLNSYHSESPICASSLPVQIMVPAPYTSSGLHTDRIAILVDGRVIDYVKGYRWEDRSASIIQRQIVDLLNASRCFAGAGTGGMALRADYRLEVDVKELYFVRDQDNSANVSMLLRLVDVKNGNLAGQYAARAEKPAGKDMYAAMESAIHTALLDALDWLRESVTKQADMK